MPHDRSTIQPYSPIAPAERYLIRDDEREHGVSSVHPQETKVDSYDPVRPLATEADHLSETFRHSHWRNRRRRVYALMVRLGLSPARIERFASCGSRPFLYQRADDPGRFQIRSNHCRDRLCEACQRERRAIVLRNLIERLRNVRTRFLTLTLRSTAQGLSEQVSRILRCFKHLRHTKQGKLWFTGGIWFLELSISQTTGLWHVHLHVITTGKFVPHTELKALWHRITGDSYICDVRAIRNDRAAASYVAGYASKSLPDAILFDDAHAEEAIRALAHQHGWQPFGSWRKWKLLTPPDPDDGWVCVGPLSLVLQLARDGDPWALRVIDTLRAVTAHNHDTS